MRFLLKVKLLMLLAAFNFSSLPAQHGSTAFRLGPPREQKILVEEAYEFYVMDHKDPLRVEALDLERANTAFNRVAEYVAIAILRAEKRGDADSYLGLVSEKMKTALDTPAQRRKLIAE